MPGHDAYRTILISRVRGHPYPHLAAECLLNTPVGLVPCAGNGPHRYGSTTCYHAMAGLECGIEGKGRIVGWFKSEGAAVRCHNLKQFQGCELAHLYAKKNGQLYQGLWFLWRKGE